MSAFCKSELRIQSWNVHGSFFNLGGNRYSKLSNDEEFVRHTSKYLIFGLVETHHTADDVSQLQMVGYKCFQVCRKKLVRGRKSGGICVYVHDSVARGVKRINTTGSESVFIKLSIAIVFPLAPVTRPEHSLNLLRILSRNCQL